MGLAAWLIANDIEMLSAEKTDKGYHLFWFNNNQELHECIDKYYKQDILQKYIQANIKLKKLIKKDETL